MPDSEAVKAFREALADAEIDVLGRWDLGRCMEVYGPAVLVELDAAKAELDEWRRLTPMRDELDALRSDLDAARAREAAVLELHRPTPIDALMDAQECLLRSLALFYSESTGSERMSEHRKVLIAPIGPLDSTSPMPEAAPGCARES